MTETKGEKALRRAVNMSEQARALLAEAKKLDKQAKLAYKAAVKLCNKEVVEVNKA